MSDHHSKHSSSKKEIKLHRSKFMRWVYLILGTLSVGMGILGIVLPVLPTTPFLLLAAALYARSSERFYYWLHHNRFFGKYLRNYQKGKGIPLRVKIMTICFLWTSILVSVIFFIDFVWLQVLLLIIAIAVSIHISMIGRKRRKKH